MLSETHLSLLLPLGVLPLGLLGPLLVDDSALGLSELSAFLMTEGEGIVSLVPLSEGCSVDNDDGVLHQSLGTDQLVVASIVDDVDDPRLAGNGLRAPGKVALIKPEGTVLLVTTYKAR